MHPVGEYGSVERIALRRLDDFVVEEKIDRIDLIKVDIDGHEPQFVEGSVRTLTRFRPAIVLEFNEQNLRQHGSSSNIQRKRLEELDYVLFSEKTGRPFSSPVEFDVECADPRFSANVWCFPRESSPTQLF
jgi:hypothetical protein